MIWRNPAAWFGLATLLIPIAIHLLARQRAESRLFPSLRFILPSRLAAVRRRAISDWLLLAVRLALLAVVVAALADPLWLSAARRAEWSTRMARAVVVDTSASTQIDASGAATNAPGSNVPGSSVDDVERRRIIERETSGAGAFRVTTIETADLVEGVRRAVHWLSAAPPGRREIVCVSDFQLGALDEIVLRDVPSHIGLRFVRAGTIPVTRDADGQPRTHRTADGFDTWTPHVTLNAHETAVTWRPRADAPATIQTTPTGLVLPPFNLRVEANDADRPLVAAAAQAVLAQGVRVPVASIASIAPIANRSSEAATSRGDDARRGHDTPMSIRIIVAPDHGTAADTDTASLPSDATRLGAPWMSDVLAQIAADTQLVRAMSRNPIARATVRDEPREPAARSSPTRSDVAASTTPGESARDTGAAAGAAATQGREARGAAATTSPPSQQSRESRNAAEATTPPAPWIVVMRDARARPALLAASESGRDGLVLVSRVAADDEATALLLRAAMRAVAGADSLSEAEVLTVPDATLARWERPAADPPASEWQRIDTHDRRWLWGAALALLVVEQVMRRGRRSSDAQQDQTYEHAA